MNSPVDDIESINSKLMLLLENIKKAKPDDDNVEDLVSELLSSVDKRQALLQTLLAKEEFFDREFLQQQFDLTQTFIKQSQNVMRNRQSLIQKENSNKRQINIYKSIDSNR